MLAVKNILFSNFTRTLTAEGEILIMKFFIRNKDSKQKKYLIILLLTGTILAGCASVPPIYQAAANGDIVEVENLLNQGVNVNMRLFPGDNSTPIHWASSRGKDEVIKLLIARGADINASDKEGATVLMVAWMTKNPTTINLLLKHGADVNIKDKEGWSILRHAVGEGNGELVKTLITYGADINSKARDGSSVLIYAAGTEANIKIVNTLIAHGADVNTEDDDGWSPLMYAAGSGNIEIVKTLIDNGADVNAKTKDGIPVLAAGKSSGNEDIVKILREAGAKNE